MYRQMLVAMSEELPSSMELMGYSSEDNKATLGASWRSRALEGLFPECPWLLLGFLLLAAVLFPLYLARCDYYRKGSYSI